LKIGGTPRNFWPNTYKMKNVYYVRGIEDANAVEKGN